MMTRRTILALPLIAALPAAAAPLSDAGELRIAGVPPRAARALRADTGIPVRTSPLCGHALARALDEGHIEAATLDAAELKAACAAMADRVIVLPGAAGGRTRVVRRALPPGLRDSLGAALLA